MLHPPGHAPGNGSGETGGAFFSGLALRLGVFVNGIVESSNIERD
jgi:hypothetical protein